MSQPIDSDEMSIAMAGARTKEIAMALAVAIMRSDLPPLHWDEVVRHIEDLLREELQARGFHLDQQ